MEGDVKDILTGEGEQRSTDTLKTTKEAIMGTNKEVRKPKKLDVGIRRPSGMNREVYALLYSDNKDNNTSSLIPTDTGSGYRQPKARLGRKHVRAWKWMEFTNSARKDGLVLSHWRRSTDEGKPYPYAQFDKSIDIPTYNEDEYKKHLTETTWSREETDHLFDLCRRFDLRFTIVHDRFDTTTYQKRSMEALKERYYSVCNRLTKLRSPGVDESQLIAYDAPHECRRKLQLEKLLSRSEEQVKEEEVLMTELKKIELRKKEREKKQQDLQKLISAAEQNTEGRKGVSKKAPPGGMTKKVKSTGAPGHSKTEGSIVFKSYDKSSGVSLRSSKMKTPMTLGQKKAKAIEQLLEELGISSRPMPTEQICVQFNDLRNNILLLLELKAGYDACEFELQSLKHRYESLPTERQAKISLPDLELTPHTPKKLLSSNLPIIDMVTSASGGRKRRLTTIDSAVKKHRKN